MPDRSPPCVLLISLGQLNGLLLKQLARTPGIGEIVVATRNPERATRLLNLARMSAGAEGYFPIIRAIGFDFNETDAAAETLSKLHPDMTVAAPSLQSWWVLDQLPEGAAAPLRGAGFGAWLPFQLLPMIRLMRAWKASGLETPILSAPFPDVANPILATQGLAPTCGVGNIDEIVPKIRWAAAEQVGVSPADVRVWLAAHHALERYAYSSYGTTTADEPPPFLLHIQVAGKAVGPEFDARAALLAPYPLVEGLDFHFLTVGSMVRLVMAFLKGPGERTCMHVPAPEGLPGGYPVVVEDGAVSLDLPEGWTQEQAVEVNRASHKWDGIEAIQYDGTVVFTEQTIGTLRETLGYDRPRMAFDAVEAAADELRRRFDEYVSRKERA